MGTPKSVALAVVEGIPEVRTRSMMGEWLVYYREKMVGVIEDGQLYVTPVPSARRLLTQAPLRSPHAGAKARLAVQNTEDKARLVALFEEMWEELPEYKSNVKD